MSIIERVRRTLACALAFGFLGLSMPQVLADEGMWTFDNPPLKQLKERYQFEPNKEWFDQVRLSSVRLNDGGSGSFVSPNGLVMTNHHVASSQLAKLSTKDRDLLLTGFYARSYSEELKCPDLEIDQLASIENVTERVQNAAAGASDDKTANARRKAETAKIEKESQEKTGLISDAVELYGGGEYWLYRYKRYTDIRMVFAPESQIAFFGGDPDNFTYPRFSLDMAFLRVYENDKPLKTERYFRWSARGAQEKELIFVCGNPGSTDRLETVAQLEFQRDYLNPVRLHTLGLVLKTLKEYGKLGQEQERRATDLILGYENANKAIGGEQESLLDPKVMAKKKADEDDLRNKAEANPELQKNYGAAWNQLAEAYKAYPSMLKRLRLSNIRFAKLPGTASALVRYAAEVQKPNDQRLAPYRDTNLESLKFQLLSPAPVYTDMEEVLIAATLKESLEELGPEDPFVKAALGGRKPAEVAKELVQGTRLMDVEFRKSLLEGGPSAIEKSTDPMIVLMRKVDPIRREVDKWREEKIDSVQAAAGEKISKARFAVYGKNVSPDATFTLRLSYGTVAGYTQGTTFVPYKTTFHGLYDRAASFDYKPPFDLPERYLARKSAIDPTTPFNFVATADIIGGNSGSPVINRNAEIVGLIFDGNIQSLLGNYLYTDETARSVAVHSLGIIESLRKLYDAGSLADELEGKKQ